MTSSATVTYSQRIYDLTDQTGSSDEFYRTLRSLTDEVTEKAKKELHVLIEDYRSTKGYSNSPEVEDIIIDILIIGVLWNVYAGISCKNLAVKKIILNWLFSLRKQHETLKPYLDKIRGKLAFLWLRSKNKVDPGTDLITLKRLSLWLAATNDFVEEVNRIEPWIRFLSGKKLHIQQTYLEQISLFASWFQEKCNMILGKYTVNVSSFLVQHEKLYRNREDYFYCGRRAVEYHLNMVAAELMNRFLATSYRQTENQILLLPACMAAGNPCKARIGKEGLVCVHCTRNCRVSHLARESENAGQKTILIQHSSRFSNWLKPWAGQKETGLIGVACVLNLILGGFEMQRLNIPSQCVFLDYCGCKKHWDKTGFPTDINEHQVINCFNGAEIEY